jgi:hypothetical protein
MIVMLVKLQVEHKGRLHVRRWEIAGEDRSASTTTLLPRHVPSCLGLHAHCTNSQEACEHPAST